MFRGKSRFRFRPTLWPTLAALVLIVVFLRLALWQVHRAEYKRQLLAQYHAVSLLPPISLNAVLARDALAALPRYRHARVQGRYDGAHQILLEDMQHGDQVGYEVLTPLLLEPAGPTVLVDRGFLAANPAAGKLPDVAVPDGSRTVTGLLGHLPVPGLRLGGDTMPAGWPKALLYPRHDTLAPLYPGLIEPVLLLDPDQSEGFVRDWRPDVGFPPARHLGYAFQWLALAVAVLIVWLVVNFKRSKPA